MHDSAFELTLFPSIVGPGNVPPARTTLMEEEWVEMCNPITGDLYPRACVPVQVNVCVRNG